MTKVSNRGRKHSRIELVNEVYYESGGQSCLASWTDLSEGGIHIQTMTPLPVGTRVKMRIRLEPEGTFYHAVGIVRHSLLAVGMGIEFTGLHPGAKRIIREMADR
ncbi:MAG: PilZ domain-containing protein [Acidobacteriota bacterium]